MVIEDKHQMVDMDKVVIAFAIVITASMIIGFVIGAVATHVFGVCE
jgi:type III secretory pathway component EscT